MVYIEYVIANNLLANSVIFTLTSKASGLSRTKGRIFIVVMLGTLFGVVFPMLRVSEFWCLVIKFLSALLLTLMITGRVCLKKYLITLIIFYGISFGLGGAVSSLLSSSTFLPNSYTEEELTFCIMSGGVVFVYIAGQILSYIRNSAAKGCTTVYLKDKLGGQIACSAFVDSGNSVTYRGFGVNFVPNELKSQIEYEETSDFVSVITTAGSKIFQVSLIPYMRYSNGKEEEKSVPVIFWQAQRKDSQIILHRGR